MDSVSALKGALGKQHLETALDRKCWKQGLNFSRAISQLVMESASCGIKFPSGH